MAAWVAPVVAAGASLLGSMMSGSGDSKSGGQPMYMARNMPSWLRDKYEADLRGMPTMANVNFGGQTFPGFYGPTSRMAKALYDYQGGIPLQYQPSAFTGAMQAMAPYMWQTMRDPYKSDSNWLYPPGNNGSPGMWNWGNTTAVSPTGANQMGWL